MSLATRPPISMTNWPQSLDLFRMSELKKKKLKYLSGVFGAR